MERPKVLVAHSAQQHSFKTAEALKECGYLYKYITTVYDRKNSATSMIKKLLRGDNLKRANTRKSDKLDDSEIVQYCEIMGLILLLLQRIDRKKVFYNYMDRLIVRQFNKKVYRYAIKQDVNIIIMYDTLCYNTFRLLNKKKSRIIKVIDMSAPNFEFMHEILVKELSKNNYDSKYIYNEISSANYKSRLETSRKEIKLANYFLSASSVTKKSLINYGINEKNIFNCPYGIYTENHKISSIQQSIKKIKCIYIGRVTPQKGATYFFDAIDRLDSSIYEFDILGAYDQSGEYYQRYKDICNFRGHVTKDQVVNYCKYADIMVFPSLADGFGFSVLEALSCGVPVICSTNAGMSDFIIDGYNGFNIPPYNSQAICDKLIWAKENKEILNQMRYNAANTACNMQWADYNDKLKDAIDTIFQLEFIDRR